MPNFDELFEEFTRLQLPENENLRKERHPDYGIKRGRLIILQLLAYHDKNSTNLDSRFDQKLIKFILQKEEMFKTDEKTLSKILQADSTQLKKSGVFDYVNRLFTYDVSPELSKKWLDKEQKHLNKFNSTIGGLSSEDIISMRYIKYILDNNLYIDGTDESDFINQYIFDLESDPKKLERLRKTNPSLLKHFGIEYSANYIIEIHDNWISEFIRSTKQAVQLVTTNREEAEREVVAGFTNYEITGIRLLSLVNPKNPNSEEVVKRLSKAEIDFLNEFIAKSMGDMGLNKKLRDISENSDALDDLIQQCDLQYYRGEFVQSMYELSTFTYKTRHHDRYNDIAKQFISNINSKMSGFFSSFRRKKITLAEFGVLSDIDKVSNILPASVYENNEDLLFLFGQAKLAHPTIEKFRSSFQDNLAKSHSMIATINMSKYAQLQGKKLTLMQRLRRWITKHDHTSIIYRKEDGAGLTQSHLNFNVEENKFSYGEFLYSDIYKIKITNLISSERKAELKQQLGSNWEEQICDMFKQIERDIHDNAVTKFDRIQVPTARGFRIRGIFSKFKYKSVWTNDFEQIRKDMTGITYKSLPGNTGNAEMLCSTFAANVVIASIMELNNQLGSPKNKKDRYVKVPFGKNEDLRTLTPDRLIKQLRKYDAVEKVVPDPDIEYHIKF